MVFEKSHFFVLGPPGDRVWGILGPILGALGLILGASWAILGSKVVPRGVIFPMCVSNYFFIDFGVHLGREGIPGTLGLGGK